MLLNNTLQTLEEGGVPKTKITIFLADEKELKDYKQKIHGYKFVVGVKGLASQRNFITDYYPEGKYIISMDDDVSKAVDKNGKTVTNLPALFERAYDEMKKHNAYIWGFNKSSNPFYMDDRVSDRFNLILGPFYGVINRHDKDLRSDPAFSTMDENERSALYWMKDGVVIRMNGYGFKANYSSAPGGQQSVIADREADSKIKAQKLVDKFPHLFNGVKYHPKEKWYLPVFKTGYPMSKKQKN